MIKRPGGVGAGALVAAGSAWAGAGAGLQGWLAPWWAALALLAIATVRRPLVVVAGLVFVAGLGAGGFHRATAALPVTGAIDRLAVVRSDLEPSRFGWSLRLEIDGNIIRGYLREPFEVEVGSDVAVRGEIQATDRTRSRVAVSSLQLMERPGPLYRVANGLRRHLLTQVSPNTDSGRALLAGFLVGDTSAVDSARQEDMRLSGLSHFTAVSGSNVALFLGLWVVVLGPLGWTPLRRPVAVLIGVALFATVTRFEPSVVRASAMVAAVMLGRLVGVALDGWSALGGGVVGCLLLDPTLAVSLGFQLSVVATLGVMAGSRLFDFRPAWMARVASASLTVQLLVAPLLLARVGPVPVLSPLNNLLAAPLVSASTAIGGIGAALGLQPLVAFGAWLARLVLAVAEVGSTWPQMGWAGYLLTVVAVASSRYARRFPALLPAGALVLALLLWPVGQVAAPPAVVFFDVGQGDAALILAPSLTILVDGGPDERALAAALRRYRIRAIDLVVVSHAHADHIDGLGAVIGRVPVGVIWDLVDAEDTESAGWLLLAAGEAGIPRVAPPIGHRLTAEDLAIDVLGPTRRYSGLNDRSLVLMVELAGVRILMAGDAESLSQADLGDQAPDVLKVPHHGSDSSDAGWLSRNAGRIAVISSGVNDYGHPSPDVVATLKNAGALVYRTDESGDVVLTSEDLARLSTDSTTRVAPTPALLRGS